MSVRKTASLCGARAVWVAVASLCALPAETARHPVFDAALNTDRQTWTVALPPGRTLGIDVTIGHVRVQGETREDAQIEVTRTAPTREALQRIPVEVREGQQSVDVIAVQSGGQTDPRLVTDVVVRVPRAATVAPITVIEGRVTLDSLTGRVGADLRRGPIDANALQGVVRLETGIGDITASRMRLVPEGLLRMRTFNGHVTLLLADTPRDARILALALNGAIESDIPLTMKDRWGPRFGEASLGAGEPVISLDVVTGKITIRTASR